MAIPIPSPLVEFILLGPLDDRRQLQDSPILGDVWVEFGRRPGDRLDLLIEPYRGQHAGFVAAAINDALTPREEEKARPGEAQTDEARPDETPPDEAQDEAPPEETQPEETQPAEAQPDGAQPDEAQPDEPGPGEAQDEAQPDDDEPNVAYLQGLIVARLTFGEVLRVLVPRTKWWVDRWRKPEAPPASPKKEGEQEAEAQAPEPAPTHELERYGVEKLKEALEAILTSARAWHSKTGTARMRELPALHRFAALAALFVWAERESLEEDRGPEGDQKGPARPLNADEQISRILEKAKPGEMAEELVRLMQEPLQESRRWLAEGLKGATLDEVKRRALIWQVSLNRGAVPALNRSVAAVKADAARTLFKVNCSEIVWAVLDSGIDGNHPAFRKPDGTGSRVKKSFDFKNFRRIVSLSNSKPSIRKRNAEALMQENGVLKNPFPEQSEAEGYLERLARDARDRGLLHWELVERFVELDPNSTDPAAQPRSNHGTHVAGIIGASKETATKYSPPGAAADDFADGMCPDISFYDFRVLGLDVKDTEFAIIAALQFIRYLNDRDNFTTIHGANLSLSIPHDVRNFACGRTPICDECERLINSGVVVVAAAGNHGYKSFETREGSYDSYAAFSITDPGNADSVITVGSTHRFWPHTYGVSFFSSRGPTGDGRLKPDIVAPGERIRAPLPGVEWGDLDGTSMAAPHVSGAAAMLMARYSELIGQPRRIKRLLCEAATDLGRERSFQGHGMLDVLRAFQSI